MKLQITCVTRETKPQQTFGVFHNEQQNILNHTITPNFNLFWKDFESKNIVYNYF